MSIPKKIHYCWFGGSPLPKTAEKCIESWKKFCPDFEIICWNEENSPLADNDYVRQAYDAQKWAFVSDYVRLAALYTQGGIYLDTDVELLGPLQRFLDQQGLMGFETQTKVATCFMGSEAGHPFFRQMMDLYKNICFLREDGSWDMTTNVERITELLVRAGIQLDGTEQELCGVTIYPSDYFSPKSLETGKITLTENTCAIHYFDASWMSRSQRFHTQIAQLLGPKWTRRLKKLMKKTS